MGRSVPAWGRAGLTRRDGCRRVAHANARVRGSLGLAAEPAAPSPPLHPQSPRMICGSDGMLGLRKGFGFAGEGLRLCRCMDRARAAPDAGPLLRTSRGERRDGGAMDDRPRIPPASRHGGYAVAGVPQAPRGPSTPRRSAPSCPPGRRRPACAAGATACRPTSPQLCRDPRANRSVGRRAADRLRVGHGALLPLRERLHACRRDEPRVVTGQVYPACPVTSTGADLHRAHASGRCRDERRSRITPQHCATHGCATRIRAVTLENRLDRIDPAGAHPTRGRRLQGCRNTAALAQRCRRGTSTPTLRVVLRRSPAEMRTHGNDRQ